MVYCVEGCRQIETDKNGNLLVVCTIQGASHVRSTDGSVLFSGPAHRGRPRGKHRYRYTRKPSMPHGLETIVEEDAVEEKLVESQLNPLAEPYVPISD